MKKEETEKEAYLVLMAGASQLTCEDLLRIVTIAEEGSAKVYLSLGLWQVFIRVPKEFRPLLELALWNRGYDYVNHLKKIDEPLTYSLSGGIDERQTARGASSGRKKDSRRTLGVCPLSSAG